jgi:hypothetical protein
VGFTILWVYLLAKAVLPKEGQALLAFGLASGFLLNSLHVMIYPQVFAFFTLLVVLYLRLERSVRKRPVGRIPLIILLLFIPYSHPASAVELVLLLLVIELADVLYQRISLRLPSPQISLTLPLIAAIVFFMWISSFVLFGQTVRSLIQNTLEPLQGYSVQALETSLGSTTAPLGIFLKMYGDSVACLVLALIGAVILAIKVFSGQSGLRNLWAFTAVWLIAGPLELFIFVGSGRQTVGRLANLNLMVFLSPLLAGFALYELLRRARKTIAVTASTVVLTVVWVVSVSSIYQSPWVLQPGWQITRQDVLGSEWFVKYKTEDALFSGMGYNYGLPFINVGFDAAYSRDDLTGSAWLLRSAAELVMPVGFGYDRFPTLGEALGFEQYFIVTESFRLASGHPQLSTRGLTIIPLFIPGFQPTHFEQLSEDPSANKLYSNGGMDIWHVQPVAR